MAQIPDVAVKINWEPSAERLIREARAVLKADADTAAAADAGRKLAQSVLALVDLAAMEQERERVSFSYDQGDDADGDEGEAEAPAPDIFDAARAEARELLKAETEAPDPDADSDQEKRLPSGSPAQ